MNDLAARKVTGKTLAGQILPQAITGFHTDDEGHWVSQLACGHNQHVRHDPPLVTRHWVLTSEGRDSMIGYELGCKKCVDNAPPDERPEPDA